MRTRGGTSQVGLGGLCRVHTRGPGRKPGASSYTRMSLSLSLSALYTISHTYSFGFKLSDRAGVLLGNPSFDAG
jgi:hypothetical protein